MSHSCKCSLNCLKTLHSRVFVVSSSCNTISWSSLFSKVAPTLTLTTVLQAFCWLPFTSEVGPGDDIRADFSVTKSETRWQPPRKQFSCLHRPNRNEFRSSIPATFKHGGWGGNTNVAFFPSWRISLFTQSIEGRVRFLLITLAAVIFASQLGGSVGSLTFGVVNPRLLTWEIQVERSITVYPVLPGQSLREISSQKVDSIYWLQSYLSDLLSEFKTCCWPRCKMTCKRALNGLDPLWHSIFSNPKPHLSDGRDLFKDKLQQSPDDYCTFWYPFSLCLLVVVYVVF